MNNAYIAQMIAPITIKFTKTHPDAKAPTKAHDTDAGWDLTAVTMLSNYPAYVEYDTGIAVEIPEGYVGLLFPRSSISKTLHSLANAIGVIDPAFRGSVKLRMRVSEEWGGAGYVTGDRIGQLIIIPIPNVEFVEGELGETDRGNGGFGSTGF